MSMHDPPQKRWRSTAAQPQEDRDMPPRPPVVQSRRASAGNSSPRPSASPSKARPFYRSGAFAFVSLLTAMALAFVAYHFMTAAPVRKAEQSPNPIPSGYSAAPEANAALERGLALLAKKNYDGAIAAFTEAIRIDPGFGGAYGALGIAQASKGDCEHAIGTLTDAIRLSGAGVDSLHGVRGICHLRFERSDHALDDFNRAIEIEPQFAHHFADRAKAYFAMLRFAEAAKDIEKALSLGGTQAEFLPTLSIAYLMLKRPEAAMAAEDYITRKGWREEYSLLSAILAHVSRIQSGDPAAAHAIIDRAEHEGDPMHWLFPAVQYFRGTAHNLDLYKAPKNDEQRATIHVILALSYLSPTSGTTPSNPRPSAIGLSYAQSHLESAVKYGKEPAVKYAKSEAIYHLARGMLQTITGRKS